MSTTTNSKATKTGNDLTSLDHANEDPAGATWWECETCGDYAWIWPGEEAPECSCSGDDA